MSDPRTEGLTNGYLPAAAFGHLEPTAVGVVDLERSIVPRAPDGGSWTGGQRDGLLLVRLHEEPLAVLHINRDPRNFTNEELTAEIWRAAGAEIRRHVERFRCTPIPGAAEALLGGLHCSTGGCTGDRPAQPGASVAVILASTGREEQLGRCLRSLCAQRRAELEVVVVDNRPATGEVRRVVSAIAAGDARVRYVPESRVGLSVARNRGVGETDAELVAFTDDDAVADPCWLEWLLAPFAEPEVTASCGMVLPLELQTEAQKRFEQYAGFSKGVERRAYDMRAGRAGERLLYPFWGGVFGSGNSMAFRRAELVAAGGFDPALGAGSLARSGEDIYAFSTAILRGGRLVYEPRALCWHEHRKDGDALRGQVFGYGVGLGAIVTKALSSDPRFFAAAARSVPIALALRRRRRALTGKGEADGGGATDGAVAGLPEELLRAQRRGMLHGPLRYAQGVVRAHRLGLGDVIRGG
ncbi:MAG TPA: glycosyltransferase [Solirubrobacteraceae bacterium]|jgi:GT2 family glycosyltransferase|nr:glycosyltransferase [Solirubrobacteraceae bacterium]